MTLQTNKNDPSNGGRQELEAQLRSIWLGMRDSNPRMHGPKPCALPLGQSPIRCFIITQARVRIINNQDSSHVPRPRNFCFANKFASEDCLANCHWQFSPRMHGPKPCALPLGQSPIFD
jgi:hypothetical protein